MFVKKERLLVPDGDRRCLSDHFGRFLATDLRLSMETGPWLAGGAVRKNFIGQAIDHSDWDIWFSSEQQFLRAEERMLKFGAYKVHSSANASTFKYTGRNIEDVEQTIQLIKKKYYTSPEEIIDGFDFTICQLVTDGDTLMVGEKTLYDLNRRLIRSSSDILQDHVIPRMIKYMVYGYRPTKELLDMIQINLKAFKWETTNDEYDSI